MNQEVETGCSKPPPRIVERIFLHCSQTFHIVSKSFMISRYQRTSSWLETPKFEIKEDHQAMKHDLLNEEFSFRFFTSFRTFRR